MAARSQGGVVCWRVRGQSKDVGAKWLSECQDVSGLPAVTMVAEWVAWRCWQPLQCLHCSAVLLFAGWRSVHLSACAGLDERLVLVLRSPSAPQLQ